MSHVYILIIRTVLSPPPFQQQTTIILGVGRKIPLQAFSYPDMTAALLVTVYKQFPKHVRTKAIQLPIKFTNSDWVP